ncbi:MAG: hypothetical protein KIS96_12215 [Bauldia sp.]|nr:hypothetical protein [Bauldia sp.]
MADHVIQLDASQWRRPADVDQALKAALGAPEGHGKGPDAWIDSMVYGGMNAIEPPYRVDVANTSNLDEATWYYLLLISTSVALARMEKMAQSGIDTDVSIAVFP